MTPEQEAKDPIKAEEKRGFIEWMERPEVKMVFSLLPNCTTDAQKDAQMLLFRSAFEAGCNCGSGYFAMQIMEGMFDRESKKI